MGELHSSSPAPLHKEVTISIPPLRMGGPKAVVKALDLSGSLDAAVIACMDSSANYRAMELGRRLVDARMRDAPLALYVIGPPDLDVMKIGYATHPVKRLCELQIGNWRELKIHGIIWFDKGAGSTERLAHKAAKEMGISLRGEWIESTAADAVELALKAARYDNARVYDSAQWIENWALRADALAKHRRIDERAVA